MDRQRISHLAHERHPVACPFSDATVDALVARLDLPRAASVLDVGCGRAEWLVRVLERAPDATGVGVDLSPLALDAAGRRARAAGVETRLALVEGDGAEHLRGTDDAHDLITCTGSEHVLGTADDAWRILSARLRPGGLLLLAQGFWACEPTAAALAELGENLRDALPRGVSGLVASVVARGLAPLHVVVSSEREWDDYEWSWVGSLEDHAWRHPGPEADELRAVAASHRDGYLNGYRGVLGYAAVIARRAG